MPDDPEVAAAKVLLVTVDSMRVAPEDAIAITLAGVSAGTALTAGAGGLFELVPLHATKAKQRHDKDKVFTVRAYVNFIKILR